MMADELLGDNADVLYGRHANGSMVITLGPRSRGRHHANCTHAFVQHWGNDEWGCGYRTASMAFRCAHPRHNHPTIMGGE